jgi:TP901 family phage tail tape measure protein
MAGKFSIEAVFKAIDRVSAPVSKMQNRVGKFTRKMSRGLRTVNRQVDKLGRGLRRAATVGAASLLIITGAATNIVAAGADFEQAITNVGAVSLQTRDQIKPLEELALQLGRTTKFTATQSANAMEIMARAGFKTNEILTATPAILAAAAASGLEIAEVADVVSNSLKGMGLEAGEAARVADVLALASAKTNSTIGSLGESLKNVASTARQLNVPIESAVASVALLQDVGLDASVAGSAFNTMLTKMAAPTKGMQKKMKAFGISFKDAKGDMLPLGKVLQQLNVASKKVGGNFDKVAFLAELVGLRGQKAASNLGDLFKAGKLTKLTEELEKASGVAKKMADIRMDTLQGRFELLNSATEGLKITLTGLKSGVMSDIVTALTGWVSKIDEVINSNKALATELIDGLMQAGRGLVGIFGLLLGKFIIMKTFLISMAVLTQAWTATLAVLKVTMAAFSLLMSVGPIGAIALLITLGALLISNWETIVSVISSTIDFIAAPFKDLINGIMAITGAASGLFGGEASPEVVSPQARTARTIEESRQTSTAEVTIKDETGRAEMTGGKPLSGIDLVMCK